MQALLSFEQAPPISAPLRFFLTAPVFAILAGLLLIISGPDLLASRWTPAALALTHLITTGFMLQAMLGAMVQILPVVAGANLPRPLLIAGIVHVAITCGSLCLALAFLTFAPLAFAVAAVLLAGGLSVFVAATGRALYGIKTTSPTIRGLKIAISGLIVTVSFGALLAFSLAFSFDLPLLQLTNIHLGWGFVAWGCALLAAVGYVVVPMFQLTPAYPEWFGKFFSFAALGVAFLWTFLELVGWLVPAAVLGGVMVFVAALFAVVTLGIQRRSKRAKFDVTQHYWRVAMASALVACALWLAAQGIPAVNEWQGWPLLFGVLVLFGGFMSVIIGMLYKIVPFLVWLHLQSLGRGKVIAPNMKKVLAETQMKRQMLLHFVAFTLLLLAVFWPQWFVYPAGVALIVANGWLLRNLVAAVHVYRGHLPKIKAALAVQAGK